MKQIKDAVERAINNIRIASMGIVTSVLKSRKELFIQIADEELRDVKLISPYGIFSLPINGQMGQIIFNNTSKKVSFIGVEHENIPIEIKPGETLIYAKEGQYLLLRDGKFFFHGDLEIDGNIKYKGNLEKV